MYELLHDVMKLHRMTVDDGDCIVNTIIFQKEYKKSTFM